MVFNKWKKEQSSAVLGTALLVWYEYPIQYSTDSCFFVFLARDKKKKTVSETLSLSTVLVVTHLNGGHELVGNDGDSEEEKGEE